ncbi:hypothetical protein AAFF_G00190470 [Aldrovandia affinis]|uniref:Protein FAM217B n=1 Tax=Aldrovandia affinis TaxID=143900 RepID=A0AAD7W5T1_9TELE|nr:hypothetical protein AAFF_G00190470 [Aldrovandia affinis]
MGPILQERAATIASKKVSAEERVRSKNSGINCQMASSKKGKVGPNCRPHKKGAQPKYSSSREGKDPSPATERGLQRKGNKAKPDTHSIIDNGTLLSIRGELNQRPPVSLTKRKGEEIEVQPGLEYHSANDRNQSSPGRSRRALSLPLTPRSELRHEILLERQPPTLESLRLYEQEEDTDSASDLSSTPPTFIPLPGPRGLSHSSYSYPDFLPPPFNTWSLRQLALFLNTEGRGAPRPRPVGKLEKYLERLLQLEWLQIQTVQEESGKPVAPASASRLRPHTAPLSTLLSGSFCPHCRIRYPFCNGTCRSYAYQRHSRLSPVLERKAQASIHPKRSSSESRVSAPNPTPASCGRKPGSPLTGNNHLKRMQAVGNVRKPPPAQSPTSKLHPVPKNACTGAGTNRPKGQVGRKADPCGSLREVSPKKGGNERKRAGVVARDPKPGSASKVGAHSPISKGPPTARANGKLKRVAPIKPI